MGHMLQPNYSIVLKHTRCFPPLWLGSYLSLCLKNDFPYLYLWKLYSFLNPVSKLSSSQRHFITLVRKDLAFLWILKTLWTIFKYLSYILYHLNCCISIKGHLEEYHLSLLWIPIMLYHFYGTHHTLPYVIVMHIHDISAIIALRVLPVCVYRNA